MFDMLEDTDKLYLVLELATGGDLFDLIINRGGFSEEDSRGFFHQIIAGLEYAHSLGVVHRSAQRCVYCVCTRPVCPCLRTHDSLTVLTHVV